MPNLPWHFAVRPPGAIQSDPTEGEFFSSGVDTKHVDSLIREAVQNALDAAKGVGPVRVRFALHSGRVAGLGRYVGGLHPHLVANGLRPPAAASRTNWLVYEDFGTTGLRGDPGRIEDPLPQETGEDFYWFWRNVGRSAKTGEKLGRWGLGKTVFPSSSSFNTLLGLTVQAGNRRPLLMGQSVLRNHALDGVRYLPYGLLHAPDNDSPVPMPITDDAEVSTFRKMFRLTRLREAGLSLVVPYLRDGMTAESLLRSACLHFFLPVITKKLMIEVSCGSGDATTISHSTIENVAERVGLGERNAGAGLKRPPFEIARWIAGGQFPDVTLACASTPAETTWGRDSLPVGFKKTFSDFLQGSRKRISIRVPITLANNEGTSVQSYVDGFIAPVSGSRTDVWYVRDGMTIFSTEHRLTGGWGFEAILLATDSVVSSFLGDAEGPAHTHWDKKERLKDKWKASERRLKYIKSSLPKILELITAADAATPSQALSRIFRVSAPTLRKAEGKVRGVQEVNNQGGPGDQGLDIPHRQRWFTLTQTTGGFSITSNANVPRPASARLLISFAYDTPHGDPFRKWSPFDFEVRHGKDSTIKLSGGNGQVTRKAGNCIEFEPTDDNFRFACSGFMSSRDLVVRVVPSV